MTSSSYIQTVLGPISPAGAGVTMPHEHLLSDVTCLYVEPTTASDRFMSRQPITIDNLWWLRYHYNNHLDNLRLDDERVAIEEALLYGQLGGQTIVDATTIGESPDPLGLARISRATGLNIVAATGYYVAPSHPPNVNDMTVEEITRKLVSDITWPLDPNERKVLTAAAIAQQETNVAISIHPGRNEEAPKEIIDILLEAGASPEKIIMGHIERTIFEMDDLERIASYGCYIEWDLFGQELSYYSLAPHISRPTDAQRLDQIAALTKKGYTNKILVSHDIGGKTHLVKYGGHGYGHILRVIVPWMYQRGFTEKTVRAILIDNPTTVLAI